jgi:hypothetical protein
MAIDAHFHGVDVEFRQQFLEIGEEAGGERFAAGFVEQRGALEFAERRVERTDGRRESDGKPRNVRYERLGTQVISNPEWREVFRRWDSRRRRSPRQPT